LKELAMFEKGSAVGTIQPYFLSQIEGKLEDKAMGEQSQGAAIDEQAAKTAELMAEYIGGAQHGLDIAIYDFRLPNGDIQDTVVNAINAAAKKGVQVRIAYDMDQDTKTPGTVEYFIGAGSDPAPDGTNAFVEDEQRFHSSVARKGITTEGIDPQHHIMHQKYILRDPRTSRALLWMGSANFTVDAWAAQENNILIIEDIPDLVEMYGNDFGEMWATGVISTTGVNDSGQFTLSGRVDVDVAFAPGEGTAVEGRIADLIASAADRLYIASMVISSGKILRSIMQGMADVHEFGGIYDGGSMAGVRASWEKGKASHASPKKGSKAKLDSFSSAQKLEMWDQLEPHLEAKHSIKYQDGVPHNFMHDKVAVVDDTIVTGSFNFSNNAMKNAENILVIKSQALADQYATYIQALLKRYASREA
jgi:phosphatidylserine/phosphatidylglycerophosphate/cardiolipin synthase-like enzyme